MTTKKPPPRYDEFLNAALKRFASQGYAASSTREICADLGLAHSAVYNYFKSKEQILLAIEDRELRDMQSGVDALLAEPDTAPLSRLRKAIAYTLHKAISRRDGWNVLHDIPRNVKGAKRKSVVAHRDRFEQTMRSLLQDCIDSGDLPDQDLTLLSHNLFALADSVAAWFKPSGRLPAQTVVENSTSFFLRGAGAAL